MTDAAATVPEPNATVLLIALGRRARALVEDGLGAHGIGYRHLSALGHLAANPQISYSELARRGSVTAQSMQATLSRLEELGMVRRVGATGQGRRARLALTAKGNATLVSCRQVLSDVQAELLAPLSPRRRTAMLGLLTELAMS